MIQNIIYNAKKHKFLFEELVKRDFKKKYKRTALGMLWSVLGPLMTLGVMALVFTHFFGRDTPHYIVYLFCGNLVFNFFKESTNTGMSSLYYNSAIFSKINMPKYLFLLSRNVTALINFGITLLILFLFVLIDGIHFTWKFILLLYPILCLTIFNVGVGLILSALYIMFSGIKYLYDIFNMLLMYLSAIFYNINSYPEKIQWLFFLNPVYIYIRYFRKIIIESTVPTPEFHLVAALYALAALLTGALLYKKNNYKFLYYI